tara:strand:+ start:322 stop:630 length:309 start_codon:yes stop_codon:yes gene_type:complete
VDILTDTELKTGLNNLLISAHHPIISIYDRMFKIGFYPKDEVSTLIYSIGIFTVKYNEYISSNDIDSSIRMSYNDVLKNKIVSSFIANKAVNTVDNMVGVKQ